MQSSIINLLRQCIRQDFHLPRVGKRWSLGKRSQTTLIYPNQNSLGFSLDCERSPFPFLTHAPPAGIAKMCDGIIVLSYKNKNYLFLIEEKASYKGGYKKQLANGKYFCDWLFALLKEHGHYDSEVTFICLLCWRPREKSPHKGETHHGNFTASKNLDHCNLFFEIKNKSDIFLLEFIR